MISTFYSIDLPALICAALAGLACGLCGSLLLLRQQTMMADALSHSLLPGLVIAFIISGSLNMSYMLTGAFISCAIAALLIYAIQSTRILNANMAMGIVLTSFFALGVLIIETLIDNKVHLDTEHALYGALELTYWPDAGNLKIIPPQIPFLAFVCITLIFYLFLSHPRLKLQLSDPDFAKSIGKPPIFTNILIIGLTILVCVASFEAVGSILVLALIVCPPACAFIVTKKLSSHIVLSGLFGMASAIFGYYIGAILPLQLGWEASLNAAGMIALTGGLMVMAFIIYTHIHKS